MNVWPKGADWMTRSFANCSARGGTIDKPAGGGLFLPFGGPLAKGLGFSMALADSGALSPFADFSNRDSMIDRCWSRTEMLLCSCSRIVGSCVWNPGDKHANPTSCIDVPTDCLELRGAGMFVVVFKSSLRGRCRAFGPREGEEGGSFFTIILGLPLLRDLPSLAHSISTAMWIELTTEVMSSHQAAFSRWVCHWRSLTSQQ